MIHPTGDVGEREIPEEYWKRVIAEVRIAYLPPDTEETIKSVFLQPSTNRLAKFITEKIAALTSENADLRGQIKDLKDWIDSHK